MNTSIGTTDSMRRAQWQPPGDLPEPSGPLEAPELPPDETPSEPTEVPESPPEELPPEHPAPEPRPD